MRNAKKTKCVEKLSTTEKSYKNIVKYGDLMTKNPSFMTLLARNIRAANPVKLLFIAFSLLLIYPVMASAALPDADPNLISYWSFNEGSGTVAADSNGNGNNGTLINNPVWTDGINGKALQFDGTSNYVEVLKSKSLDNITDGITIKAWVKTPLTGRGTIVERWLYNPNPQRSYVATIETDGSVQFLLSADGSPQTGRGNLLSRGKISPNTWTHIAITSDWTTMKIYINGEQDPNTASSPSGGIHKPTANLHIGTWQYSTTARSTYLNGSIDEVKIYSRALSAEEVKADYDKDMQNTTLPTPTPTLTNNLVSYWSFNEGSGTVAADSNGNGNNGTLINNPVWTDGINGKALQFDGKSNYVEVLKSKSLDNITDGITIKAWVKTPLTGRGTIVERWLYNPNPQRSYVATIETDGSVQFLLSANGLPQAGRGNLLSSGKISPNTWTHIAITSDGTTMKIYINGEQDPNTASSPSGGIHKPTANLHIGTWQYSTTARSTYLNGSIDEVKIYSRALSAEEVKADYDKDMQNTTLPTPTPTPTPIPTPTPSPTPTTTGKTYYISPSGSDSNLGTLASPWKTFRYSIPKLVAGDTLILMDGTYTSTTTGLPSINIDYRANNGTASKPITMKAQNERKALLQASSSAPAFYMTGASYWIIDGIYFKGGDSTYSGMSMFRVRYSDHITLRRLLGAYNNRYYNTALLTLELTSYSLVEESEFYWFHRHGLSGSGGVVNGVTSHHNTFRRNYINSRNYPDIPGGYASGDSSVPSAQQTGDEGLSFYPAHDNVAENNIIENVVEGFTVHANYPLSDNNRYFGNIALNAKYGGFYAGGRSGNLVKNTQYINNVVVSNTQGYYDTTIGIYLRDVANNTIDRTSVLINAPSTKVYGVYAYRDAGTANSVYFTNTDVKSNKGNGFYTSGISNLQFDYTNAFGVSIAWTPNTATNSLQINPQLSSCTIYTPSTSPLKGAGKNGADIGANILYRYQNGVLTNQPLWNPTTGEFPHGAIIAGVNDIPGQSAFDVHKRLNVNTNGCLFPSGYGN